MSISTNQIINGHFQDLEGNPLNLGTLTLQLCGDSQAPGVGLIGSGVVISVALNSSGNVANSVSFWPNDLLVPYNSYYIAKAYSSNGQLVWGPNYVQILSSPSPFSLDVWNP